MAGLKKSKRVSWAPDVKLCQEGNKLADLMATRTKTIEERLFLSEDPPTQSGLGAQDNLQSKASWLLHTTAVSSDDSPPPGFEAPHAAYCFQKEILQIPLTKWQCPPRMVLDPEWLVIAGEESKEVSLQNRRQLGVFEEFYPRPSSIPPDPFISSEAQDTRNDDILTPLIPIITIEEEEDDDDDTPQRSDTVQLQQPDESWSLPDIRFTVEHSQCNSVPGPPRAEKPAIITVPGAEPDIVAAASAAFTAIMMSSEEGSLIDRDLLIQILNNPSLMEKLVSEYEASKQTQPFATLSAPPPPPQIYPPPNGSTSATVNRLPSPVATIQTAAKTLDNGRPVKDINYYKSLIRQHGEERESLDPNEVRFPDPHDYKKPKILKPCVYFNSPRGCRHGASCLYQHDAYFPQRDEQPKGAKRIRLDRGIAGRN